MFSFLKSISVGAQLVSQQETFDISQQNDGSGEYDGSLSWSIPILNQQVVHLLYIINTPVGVHHDVSAFPQRHPHTPDLLITWTSTSAGGWYDRLGAWTGALFVMWQAPVQSYWK